MIIRKGKRASNTGAEAVGAWARAAADAQHGVHSHDCVPRSLRGAFLVASMMEHRNESSGHLAEIKRRLPVGGIEEGTVDAIVFDTLIHRIFPDGFKVAKVEQFVTETVDLFPEEHKPEQALTKALIQYTLEEGKTRRDVIRYLEPARIIGILVVVIARRLALSEAEVTKLVAEAERQAEHEGVSLVPLIEP